MPFYHYHCPANGQTLEVMHGIQATMRTWGELCARAGTPPGDTAADSPVEKVIGQVGIRASSSGTWTPAQDRRDGHTCGPGCSH